MPKAITVVNKEALERLAMDDKLLELAVKGLTRRLDELVGDCLNADGTIKAPTKKTLMRARAALPHGYKNSFEQAS